MSKQVTATNGDYTTKKTKTMTKEKKEKKIKERQEN